MDINSMNNLFSMITLLFGGYCFYGWYQLRDGRIPEKFALLGNQLPPEKCLDEEYYVSYMRPRLLFFGIAMVLAGLIGVLDAQFDIFNLLFADKGFLVSLVLTSIVPFAIIVWFAVCVYKIQKELW